MTVKWNHLLWWKILKHVPLILLCILHLCCSYSQFSNLQAHWWWVPFVLAFALSCLRWWRTKHHGSQVSKWRFPKSWGYPACPHSWMVYKVKSHSGGWELGVPLFQETSKSGDTQRQTNYLLMTKMDAMMETLVKREIASHAGTPGNGRGEVGAATPTCTVGKHRIGKHRSANG